MRAALVAGVLLALPGRALADTHDHAGMVMADESAVSGGVSLVAAQFGTMYYVGSYEGVVPSLTWARGPVAVTASLPIYHLDENGLGLDGIGDAMLHAHARLAAGAWGQAGAALMVMAPTGNGENGLGMGHVMVQPMAWVARETGAVTLSASGGFNRGIANLANHVHGIWPLVEPMNMSELTWSAAGDVALGRGIRGGARVFGGSPIGAPGIERVIAAARVAWGSSRMTSGVELQAGLAGDPFTVRGVLDTAVVF